jgi:hypothetical protein
MFKRCEFAGTLVQVASGSLAGPIDLQLLGEINSSSSSICSQTTATCASDSLV